MESRENKKSNPDLPLFQWSSFFPEAKVVYITSVKTANAEVQRLWTRNPHSIVGFDIEWKPCFRKGAPENPVAVVQIGSEESILIIQISAMPVFPKTLLGFLASPHVFKAGVAIQGDCKKLWRDCRVSINACVDLSPLARSCDPQWKGPYRNPIGLSRLTETYLDRRLPKGRVQLSDWSRGLSPLQLEYAANDCISALVIYHRLFARLNAMDSIPDAECYMFDAVRGTMRVRGDDSGRTWSPRNPQYDPGPPPPPREHTSTSVREVTVAGIGAAAGKGKATKKDVRRLK